MLFDVSGSVKQFSKAFMLVCGQSRYCSHSQSIQYVYMHSLGKLCLKWDIIWNLVWNTVLFLVDHILNIKNNKQAADRRLNQQADAYSYMEQGARDDSHAQTWTRGQIGL